MDSSTPQQQRHRRLTAAANKRVTGMTWINASYSVTVTLPKRLAAKHGLDEPCTVVFEDKKEGILIKKLELD